MQYWWLPILFASASLVYHTAPTLAFLPPSTFTSTTSSVAESTPRIQSGYYYSQPTSHITYSGDNTAIASTIQPLVECSNDVFNSAAYASSSFDIASGVFTTDNIKVAFNVATFFPQIPWLFLILLPNANITKKLMGGYGERGHMIFNVVSRGDDVHFLNTPPYIHTQKYDRDRHHMLPRAFLHSRILHCSARWYCTNGWICECIRPKWWSSDGHGWHDAGECWMKQKQKYIHIAKMILT